MPVFDVKKFVINSINVNSLDFDDDGKKSKIIGKFGVVEYIEFDRDNSRRFTFSFKVDQKSKTILIKDDGSLCSNDVIKYVFEEFIIGTGVYRVITSLYGLKWSLNRHKAPDSTSVCFYFGDDFDDENGNSEPFSNESAD